MCWNSELEEWRSVIRTLVSGAAPNELCIYYIYSLKSGEVCAGAVWINGFLRRWLRVQGGIDFFNLAADAI